MSDAENTPQGQENRREVTMTVNRGEGARRSVSWKVIVPLVVFLLLALVILARIFGPTRVDVIRVTPTAVTRTVTATGQVEGARESDIGVDIAGVVATINAPEGTRVNRGQLLLTLRTTELDAEVNRARQAVQVAQAQLSQVLAGPSQAEIERARAQLAQARQVGDANVSAARARLRDLEAGAQTEEILQAQAEVRRQRALEAQAASDLRRTRSLVERGALAPVELERAQTAYETARANRIAAEQQLALVQAGTRQQQIAQARADLQAAIANRDTSVRAAQAALNNLLAQPRPEEVSVAQAQVDQTQAQLNIAIANRARASVYAPYSGTITQVFAEEGQPITPGQTAMTLVEIGNPRIVINPDESNLNVIEIGQPAVVTSQAFPGREVEARVSEIGRRIDPEQGTVEVRLTPEERAGWLRSNLTVDVSIVIESEEQRIIIPADAVERVGGETYAMLAENGRAVQRPIETGGAGPQGVVVLSGLSAGDLVIRNADSVNDGDRITYGQGVG